MDDCFYFLKPNRNQWNKNDQCQNRNENLCHSNIEICFFMGQFTDAQQCNLCALMRQGIQCTCGNGADTMDSLQTDTHAFISICQCRKGNAHTAGSRTAHAGADGNGHGNEYQGGT